MSIEGHVVRQIQYRRNIEELQHKLQVPLAVAVSEEELFMAIGQSGILELVQLLVAEFFVHYAGVEVHLLIFRVFLFFDLIEVLVLDLLRPLLKFF